MTKYPERTSCAVKLNKLIRIHEKLQISELPSTKMIKCASILPEDEFIGWQISIPCNGHIDMALYGSNSINASDLEWIAEICAKTGRESIDSNGNPPFSSIDSARLYQLTLMPSDQIKGRSIGFNNTNYYESDFDFIKWPVNYSNMFAEIVKVLRENGAIIRFAFGKPSPEDFENCKRNFTRAWRNSTVDSDTYWGKPISTSILIALPDGPTIRMKSIFDEAIPGLSFSLLGTMAKNEINDIWTKPLTVAKTLPEYAARILMMEPLALTDDPIIGVETCEKETPLLPASHDNPKSVSAVTIGKALFTSGETKKIKIDDEALKMHWDLVGMSGTGKKLVTGTDCSFIYRNRSFVYCN